MKTSKLFSFPIPAAAALLATGSAQAQSARDPWYAYCYTDDAVDAKAVVVTRVIQTPQNDFNMGGVAELKLEPKWRAFMKGKYNEGYTNIGCTAFAQDTARVEQAIESRRANAERAGNIYSQVNWTPSDH